MSRFRPYETVFEPEELALLQRAYEDACRKLGLDPAPADPEEWRSVRDALANAVINAAKFGERDQAALSAFAIAFGMLKLASVQAVGLRAKVAGVDNRQRPRRTRENIVALVVLAAIVLAGTLLFSRFIRDVAIMKCVTAGRQDCVERIDAAPPQ